jgi:anionic cell wall polymer biosynthesis LytR-Cps2A-Psr (LCP) family protein
MNGVDVLAFSRARHGVPGGDIGRSKNQGSVIKYSLRKMRAETKTKDDLKEWLEVLFKFAKLDMSMPDALELAMLARKLLPADLVNIVAPGKGEMVGDQSVIMLGEEAKRLFDDVAMDAVADGDTERNPPKPTPTPKPKPTPSPGPPGPGDVLPSIDPSG